MYLTKEEERMLEGEYGNVVARCMKLLVKLGEKFGAERMVEVRSVQIAGVSYKNIGDPGLEFLEGFANEGAKVKVTSFMNPAGMPMEGWEEIGIPSDFAEKQKRVIEAFRKMGVIVASTCTPYLAGMLPRFREHIAWSESSAVAFSNSVVGARTNREGGPSALAAAITGRTPYYGFHLDENRNPNFVVRVDAELKSISDYGALGCVVGKAKGKGVPYFTGIKHAGIDELKSLGASLAAYGAVALFHVEGITPEARKGCVDVENVEETIDVGEKELKEAYEAMSSELEDVELIAVGCPHASINEIREICELLKGKKLKVPMWIFTSQAVKSIAKRAGISEELEKAGAKLIEDTCPVVAPLDVLGIKKVAVNSGKAAFYLPNTNKQMVLFDDISRIIDKFAE